MRRAPTVRATHADRRGLGFGDHTFLSCSLSLCRADSKQAW